MNQNITCGLCHQKFRSLQPITRYTQREEQYYRCSKCGSIFLFSLPEEETNLAFESQATAEHLEAVDEQRRAYFQDRLRLLESLRGGVQGELLEIGCGAGRFLDLANQSGWKVTGIEMSEQLARRARQGEDHANVGIEIITGDFLKWEVPEETRFDVVVAMDVLEHVLDPDAMLKKIHLLLR